MYLKSGDEFFDYDLDFLEDFFTFLDAKLDDLQQRIEQADDPDQMGLLDDAEYLAGLGFVACQRYLATTFWPIVLEPNDGRSEKSEKKKDALKFGPRYARDQSYAQILNSAANYWKHVDEWNKDAVIARDSSALKGDESATMSKIETVIKWSDYTCFNLLAALTDINKPRFAVLVPVLIAWRKQLDESKSNKEPSSTE